MSRDPITEHEAWTILADGKGHHITRRGTAVWIDDHPVTPIPNRLPTCRPPVGAVFRTERTEG